MNSTTRAFVRPSAGDMSRLAQDEDLAEVYIDALASMHDLLCSFVPDQGMPREISPAALERELRTVTSTQRPTLQRATCLAQNIEENRERVMDLRKEAERAKGVHQLQAVQWEIRQFLELLIKTFQELSHPQAHASGPTRSP